MPKPKLFLVALAFCSISILAHAQDSGSQQQSFVSGGDIRFDLSAGDYDFTASPDDSIRISWRWDNSRRSSSPPNVKAQVKVTGRNATVVTDGPHNNIHYSVEVPRSANLNVRLSAGDIRIGRIEGNKNVAIHAGDVRIAVGDPGQYSRVDVSVKVGDLNVQPFGASKDGLFRAFHWSGKGSYRLQVHLGAGDINLVSSDSI